MKHLLTNGLYKLAEVIKAQAKETSEENEAGDMMLTSLKSACIYGYGVATPQDDGWKENK